MSLRIGSLFTGTGALDLAVMDVYDAEVVWHSQYEPPDKKGREDKNQYAAKILARHWPDVPNLGDITKVDFAEVLSEHGPVDILTAGFPCQPFSNAGRRLGYQDERWLWDDVARAVRELRPQLVLLENVPGLFTAPGRQPDCVCGWNLRWGRQLGSRLADNERPNQVLADDGSADGQAARPERVVGDAGRAPWSGGSADPEAGLRGDAPVGVVRCDSALPAGRDASVPPCEEGSGDADLGDAWPRVAGFDEWARNLLDAGGVGGVADGEGPDSGAEPAGDGDHGRGHCPACGRSMDDAEGGFVRRAVGDVLGSLSHLGLDAEWINLRASDIGAPHQRRRVFIRAWPAALHAGGVGRGDGSGFVCGLGSAGRGTEVAADAADLGHERDWAPRDGRPGPADRGVAAADAGGPGLEVGGVEPDGPQLPASERGRGEPAADADGIESERRGIAGVLGGQAAAELGEGDQRERARDTTRDSREAPADADHRRAGEEHQGADVVVGERAPRRRGTVQLAGADRGGDAGNGRAAEESAAHRGTAARQPGHRREAPADPDGRRRERDAERDSGPHDGQPECESGLDPVGRGVQRATVLDLRPGTPDLDWGPYEPAIRRWEAVLGRRAPWPTDALGRLSPVFTEWLMGLPDGWVTNTPGLTRPAMLRALGNGVVRQQAAHALRLLHTRAVEDYAADAA